MPRGELGGDAGHVLFADMGEVGVNPARIIPAWQDFLAAHAVDDRPVRGIGEPIWAGRSADEMAECERHEALLNRAFADPNFWLLCPYDTVALDERVVEEARRNHPFVREHHASQRQRELSGSRRAQRAVRRAPFGCATRRRDWSCSKHTIFPTCARWSRVSPPRPGSPRNAGRHWCSRSTRWRRTASRTASGRGTLRVWRGPTEVVCEVCDDGHVSDPLAGRARPGLNGEGGRGLWIANQLCELVQLRSFATGTVVRLHMRTG